MRSTSFGVLFATSALVGCATAQPELCQDVIVRSNLVTTLTYGTDGRRIRKEYGTTVVTYEWDGDVVTAATVIDGELYWTEATTFSGDIPVSVSRSDELGVMEYEYTFLWDSDGHLLSDEIDNPPDGITDQSRSWTLDCDGNVTEAADVRGDYQTNTRFTWENDLPVRSEVDNLAVPGDVEEVVAITWTTDAAGLPTLSEEDDGDDGTVDRQRVWTWDGSGRLASREVTSTDGETCSSTTWTWDTDGRVISRVDIYTCGHEIGELTVEYDLGCSGPGYEHARLDPDPYDGGDIDALAAMSLILR